jgi:hypothetical protein
LCTRSNTYLADGALELDTDQKRILIGSLIDAMERRLEEADATDHSRLAWLLMNVHRQADAKRVVQLGLELDPTSSHCRNLARRLKLALPEL